jgi:diguanylate cyclase (GGDEF)-like protein
LNSNTSPFDPDWAGIHAATFLVLLAVFLVLSGVIALRMLQQQRRVAARWPLITRLTELVLTKDPKQATLMLRFMVGSATAVTGVTALNYGASQGVIDPQGCLWLSISALLVNVTFYGVMRSGRNLRMADPALAEAQLVACVFFLAWGYVLGGVGRPIGLMLLFVFLMFNMFTSTPRVLIRASVFAAVVFGVAMAYVAVTDPELPNVGTRFSMAKLQAVYFCVTLLMLVALCLMVTFLTALRAKSSKRKAELAEALARIQDLATRDELTGLFNRRHMLELLNTEKHRCIRTSRRFCIALIDVDRFKVVNDTHGHNVGDEVLASVASIIASGLRETDVVARWGGEEFLVMFTDTDCAAAELVLSRIQMMLAASMVSETAPGLHVTFSAGLTHYDAEEMLTRTIDRADRALYAAKAAGRDRVVRLEPGQSEPRPSAIGSPGTTGGKPGLITGSITPSVALEHRHAFDVSGMGEHVHRPA